MITESRPQILVVDDEPNLRRVLGAQLSRDGYEVHTVEDGEAALKILQDQYVDVVITDLRMPRLDGLELLRRALALEPDLPVVIITAHGTIDNAVVALKSGAFDYITKPFDQNEVRNVVRKALRTRALAADEARPERPPPLGAGYGIIGDSRPIQELRQAIARVADSMSPVLITGEVGTGKQLVAHALHEGSSRRDGPFISLNCAAVAPDLLEGELFGIGAGAQGAPGPKPGRFELASGGTLFLDEIDSVPLAMQPALLRVLQDGQCARMGESGARPVNARVVTATRVDLSRRAVEGSFRQELYYRLSVVTIPLPALRERTPDIPELARHFMRKFRAHLNHRVTSIDSEAERLLGRYVWPGNVRELENVIERALLFSDGPSITAEDLPPDLRRGELSESLELPPAGSADGLKEQVKAATLRIERELIDRALKETHGNVTHAARLLKISRKGLQLKMKELGLRERDERDPA
ncbi:MAG TPA: sigma-54 dependent transcriptional regulator [Polyangiaceae bacterium]|nr:sigma-54 dependent transcriptional regulator [Polyangiaceae bacterium]